MKLKLDNVRYIVVHYTATVPDQQVTVEDITGWHKAKGWKDIGYHYVIYRNGATHLGRRFWEVGAHCRGYNKVSIGVCYVGGIDPKTGCSADTRTYEQKRALRSLLSNLRAAFPTARIVGHRDLRPTGCPGFDVQHEYADLNKGL